MLRCGIVGCGRVAQESHLPALRRLPGVRVEAACDVDPQRLSQVARVFGIPRQYREFDDFLRELDDLDLLFVATPGFTHYEIAMEIIGRKKHIFIEKPVTLDYGQAVELVKAAQENKVKVCVGHVYRWSDGVVRAQEAFNQGTAGEIYQTTAVLHGSSLLDPSLAQWIRQEREHKVLLYEHAVHLLDLQVFFAGPVKEIITVKVVHHPELPVTTRVFAMFEHQSGAISFADLQAFAPSNYFLVEIHGSRKHIQLKFSPRSYEVYSGMITPVHEIRSGVRRLSHYVVEVIKSKLIKPRVPLKATLHYRLFEAFVRSLQEDTRPPPISLEDVLPTMQLLQKLSEQVYG